jgi:hypothetical protein
MSAGNPTPNITWQKNGGPVVRSYFQPSYGKWSIALDELTKTDNGNYTCIVCNELGCINHTVALHIQGNILKLASLSYLSYKRQKNSVLSIVKISHI